MLTATSYVVTNTTPVKIVDGSNLGEFEVLVQVQFSAMLGDLNLSQSNGFQLDPIENGIGDPRGFLRLRLQGEDLYALSKVQPGQIITTLIYSA